MQAKTNIVEIQSLRDMLKFCHFNTFILIDLDNTLMESKKLLGSDQWATALMNYARQVMPEKSEEATVLALSIYHAVQFFVHAQAVEAGTAKLIRYLQAIGLPVLGVTARSSVIIEPTFRQLQEIGVSFGEQGGKHRFDIKVGVDVVLYDAGIIFCNGMDKGLCAKAYFDQINYHPEEILMIDDKKKHLEAVGKTMTSFSHFVGLRYAFLDGKVAAFDMLEANKQLLALKDSLPPKVCRKIEQLKLSSLSLFAPKKIEKKETLNTGISMRHC